MIKILSKREKLILFLTLGMIFFVFLFNFILSPILQKYDQLNSRIKFEKAKLIKYNSLLGRKDIIEAKYKKISSAQDFSFKEKDATVSLLAELEDLATKTGIRIIDLRPQVEGSFGFGKGVTVDLRAEGNMESYIKFLYEIENSLSLLKVQRLQLSAKKDNSNLESSFTIFQPQD